jgi:hypothetical protein
MKTITSVQPTRLAATKRQVHTARDLTDQYRPVDLGSRTVATIADGV